MTGSIGVGVEEDRLAWVRGLRKTHKVMLYSPGSTNGYHMGVVTGLGPKTLLVARTNVEGKPIEHQLPFMRDTGYYKTGTAQSLQLAKPTPERIAQATHCEQLERLENARARLMSLSGCCQWGNGWSTLPTDRVQGWADAIERINAEITGSMMTQVEKKK
jgi:hypothetical protein